MGSFSQGGDEFISRPYLFGLGYLALKILDVRVLIGIVSAKVSQPRV